MDTNKNLVPVYDIVNYSDCFTGVQTCAPTSPCPSRPTCPNHQFHRMGQHYVFVTPGRRMLRPPVLGTTKAKLPPHMLKGKRRYTPTPRCLRAKPKPMPKPKPKPKTTVRRTIPKNKNIKPTRRFLTTKIMRKTVHRDTVIIRRDTVLKNGKMYVRVLKGFASKVVVTKHMDDDSDFLE